MKKILLVLAALAAFSGRSFAAEGNFVFEAAASSITVSAVSVSTYTPTLISRTQAQSLSGTGKKVSWYSITLFNVNSSTMAYAFGSSESTAPSDLTCLKGGGAPVGAGAENSPYNLTEQFQGAYMWALTCGANPNTISVVHRGR
jgi:hypothetical protein